MKDNPPLKKMTTYHNERNHETTVSQTNVYTFLRILYFSMYDNCIFSNPE